MGSHQETSVTFTPAAWSDRAAGELRRIADCSERDVMAFRERVLAGDFQLMELECQGDKLGVLIWSIDTETDGRSIVINAAAAEAVPGVCVTTAIIEKFTELARVIGARTVRCWTARPGLVRKAEAMGATRRYVMEIDL